MISSTQRKDLISVALKLPRIVDALAEHFDGLSIGDVTLTVENDSDINSAYGFNIKVGTTYLVWVGTWSDAELLLGAGYKKQPDWKAHKPIEGFALFNDCFSNDWYIHDLADNLLDVQKDIVQDSILHLDAILEAILVSCQ